MKLRKLVDSGKLFLNPLETGHRPLGHRQLFRSSTSAQCTSHLLGRHAAHGASNSALDTARLAFRMPRYEARAVALTPVEAFRINCMDIQVATLSAPRPKNATPENRRRTSPVRSEACS